MEVEVVGGGGWWWWLVVEIVMMMVVIVEVEVVAALELEEGTRQQWRPGKYYPSTMGVLR